MQAFTTLTKDELLRRIKAAVLSKDPSATVMLYGSRARGDAQPDSDWDILVLTDKEVDRAFIREVRSALYDVEYDTGEVLCAVISSRSDWEQEKKQAMPFIANAQREGIVL